jgi:hypothetical protein
MPWQPMHIATFFWPSATLPFTPWAWATAATVSSTSGSSFFIGMRSDVGAKSGQL